MKSDKVVYSILVRQASVSVLDELRQYGYTPEIIAGRFNPRDLANNFMIFTIRVPEEVNGDYADWSLDLDNLLEDWKIVPGTCDDLEMFEVFNPTGESDGKQNRDSN